MSEILGDIVTVSKGKKHSIVETASSTSKRVIGISDLRDDDSITYTNDKKGVEAFPEDIMIAWDGANAGTIGYGKSGFIGSTIARLRFREKEKFNTAFVGTILKSKFSFLQNTATGATIPHISRAALESIKIPQFGIDDQIRIVTLLSRVEALIATRKENLRLLDEFLKSTFLEMFGDPVRNDKGWKKQPFGKLLSDIDSGWSPKCENRETTDDEWGVLKLSAITSCRYIDSENKALPETIEPKLDKEVKPGDLLFSRKNTYQLIAACAYVFSTKPRLMLSDLIFRFLIKDKKVLNPLYLWGLLVNSRQRSTIQSIAGGAAGSMPNISKQKLKSLLIPIPPIPIQNQFALIVGKVEFLKDLYKQNLTELENLYGALSQKAFKGELDLSRIPLEQDFKPRMDANERELESGAPLFTSLDKGAMSDPATRERLLKGIVDEYFSGQPRRSFSFRDFWPRIEFNVLDYMDDESPPLGPTDYNLVQRWLFEMLKNNQIEQLFNEAENQMELRPKS